MNVNIEVFDREVIENIVTCLNFKMDKVIFFGHHDTMDEESKAITRWALAKLCDVTDVSFEEVSTKDIDRVQEKIAQVVHTEERAGGKCYFDLTGGADMVLVAMGMYSATHNTPMHRYDIADGELKILNTDADHVDKCVEGRQTHLTINDLVKLRGGVVDRSMQKSFKDGFSDALKRDIYALWQVASSDMNKWNDFSSVLKASKTSKPNQNEHIQEWVERSRVRKAAPSQKDMGTETVFFQYLEKLEDAGCIRSLETHEDWISFQYKNSHIRSCMLDAGSILELHTYFERLDSGIYDDCKIGTHLKWGTNAADDGYMVNNEIDVLLQRGYVLTFISCKAGAPDQMALYELDTVASRFGGKYAKKELVTAGEMEPHHAQRAKEMHITVVQV